MQEHDAVAIALEGDVAAILGHGGAHARLEQLLDGVDGLGVGWLEKLALPRRSPIPARLLAATGAPDW